jgi:hypothetical protein
VRAAPNQWGAAVSLIGQLVTQRTPFAGGVDEGRGEPDQVVVLIDRSGLNRCDLVLAQAFSDQIEAGGSGA